MIKRADIVAATLEYIGTPYHEGGRVKGVGIDCGGLPICVARDVLLSTFDVRGYSRAPDPATMRAILREQLDPVSRNDAAPGDVLAFAYANDAQQHIGMLVQREGDYAVMVHCIQRSGTIMQRIGAAWCRRLRTVHRFRGVAA